MNAADKLNKILEVLASGRTLYISTAMHSIKVTAKDLAKFEKIGRDLFKVSGNSLFISAGKRYDCIDYCRFTVSA